MLDSGDYLTPQFHTREGLQNRLNKPILTYWLMALSCDEEVFLFHLSNERAKLGMRTMHWVTPENNVKKLRRLIASDKKVYVVMREKSWKEEFSDTPLVPLARDIRLKSVKRFQPFLRSLGEKGLTGILGEYVEVVVLLTNRQEETFRNPKDE